MSTADIQMSRTIGSSPNTSGHYAFEQFVVGGSSLFSFTHGAADYCGIASSTASRRLSLHVDRDEQMVVESVKPSPSYSTAVPDCGEARGVFED